MSGSDRPAAASIWVTASRNGSRSRADSRRPMVDLPAPIMPTSTTERVPSAVVISASWDALLPADEAVSGIDLLNCRKMAAFRATYTTPADAVARDSCNGGADKLGVGPILMVYSRPTLPRAHPCSLFL